MNASKELPWSSSTGETVVVLKRRNALRHPNGVRLVHGSVQMERQFSKLWSMGFLGAAQNAPLSGDQTDIRLLVHDGLDAVDEPQSTYPKVRPNGRDEVSAPPEDQTDMANVLCKIPLGLTAIRYD